MNGSLIQTMILERDWSWPAIGILAILIGLALRSFLLSGILRRIKSSNRNWYKRTQAYYVGRSLIGWVFFILFVLGAMLLWRFERFLIKYLDVGEWWIILVASLIASVFLHMRAYAASIVDAIREQVVGEKGH